MVKDLLIDWLGMYCFDVRIVQNSIKAEQLKLDVDMPKVFAGEGGAFIVL